MCRYARVITQTKSYTQRVSGNHYVYTTAQMEEQEVLYPDAHVLFNHGAVHNKTDVTAVITNKLSIKIGLKKWGKKGIW